MRILVKNIFSGEKLWVEFFDGRASLSTCNPPPPEAEVCYLSPGWLDLQINGYGGVNLTRPDLDWRDLSSMTQSLWRQGMAGWLPTLITAAPETTARNLKVIASACGQDPAVQRAALGIHLEGPYLSPEEGSRGAHNPAYIRPPDWVEFQSWQAASGNRIRLVTLAPEISGAISFIRQLKEAGVTVAIGHTNASTEEIEEAVAAGASLSTHLGNGIQSRIDRHSNPIWDQLANQNLYASLIFDGYHLTPNMMKVFLRAKEIERCILVSDAVAQAGLPPGVYETPIGGRVELTDEGRLSLYGTEYLAGSASSLCSGIENAVRLAGCSLGEAVSMVTINPRRLLGEPPPASHTLFHWDETRKKITILAVTDHEEVCYLNEDFVLEQKWGQK